MSTKAELEAAAELLHEVGRACERIDVLREEKAQLRADLAREKERADKREKSLLEWQDAHTEEQNKVTALEKELAEWPAIHQTLLSSEKSVESRLAALQAHADGLATRLEECFVYLGTQIKWMSLNESAANGTQMLSQAVANRLDAYRAFTAEGQKGKAQ